MNQKNADQTRGRRRRHGTAVLVAAAACLAPATVSTATAAPAPRADLVVRSVTVTPTAQPGKPVTITVTVKNTGRLKAGATRTAFALSKDTSVGGDVKLAALARTPRLRSGKSATTKVTVVLPSGLADGDYHLLACADGSRKVKEAKEKNNCRASAARVSVTDAIESTPPPPPPPATVLPGTLAGTLSFSDVGQSTTGEWDTWNRSATVTIAMSVTGSPQDEVFASTGSTYSLTGTNDNVDQSPSCTYERHRTESGGGTLLYTGNAVDDELYGRFTKTDLSGISLGVAMPYTAELRKVACGDTTTTSAPSRDDNEIKLAEVSRTATTVTYRPVEWYGLFSGTSDWDSITGELVLTRTG